MVTLRAKTKADTKTIEELSKHRAQLVQKVRDRDEELKGKRKFIVVWQLLHMSRIIPNWP